MSFDAFEEVQRIGHEQHRRREAEKAQRRVQMHQPQQADVDELYESAFSMLPTDLDRYLCRDGEIAGSELHWTKTEDSEVTGQISVRDADEIPAVFAVYSRQPGITTSCDVRYDVETEQIISTSGNEIESPFYTPWPPSSYFWKDSCELWRAVVAKLLDNLRSASAAKPPKTCEQPLESPIG